MCSRMEVMCVFSGGGDVCVLGAREGHLLRDENTANTKHIFQGPSFLLPDIISRIINTPASRPALYSSHNCCSYLIFVSESSKHCTATFIDLHTIKAAQKQLWKLDFFTGEIALPLHIHTICFVGVKSQSCGRCCFPCFLAAAAINQTVFSY